MKLFLALLPKQYRQLVTFAGRIIGRLDTKEEREAVIQFLLDNTEADGKLTVGQWGSFGGKLGIIKGRQRSTD